MKAFEEYTKEEIIKGITSRLDAEIINLCLNRLDTDTLRTVMCHIIIAIDKK